MTVAKLRQKPRGERFMGTNSRIKMQIKEEYGKVVYSYSAHQYCANNLLKADKTLKIIEIILSGFTSVGMVSLIAKYHVAFAILSTVLSFALVVIAAFIKAGDYQIKAGKHAQTALDLWRIREKYLSLLTDFDSLSDEELKVKREELLDETNKIYSYEERTTEKAYKRAQKALKEEEYQFFSKEEIDRLLPAHLRGED